MGIALSLFQTILRGKKKGFPAASFPHDLNISESFARSCCFDQNARGSICVRCFWATFINGSGLAAREKGKNDVGKAINFCHRTFLHLIRCVYSRICSCSQFCSVSLYRSGHRALCVSCSCSLSNKEQRWLLA